MAVPIIRNVILQAGISPSTKHVPLRSYHAGSGSARREGRAPLQQS